MRARVTVTLKHGVLDPQGKAIQGALASLGIDGIASVRQGKYFEVELAAGDRAAAEIALALACQKLLANTVIENFRVEFDDEPASAASAPAIPAATQDVTEIAARDAELPTEGHP